METLWQDVKYGARMLAKNPGFTIVAVLTLALGIGANTAIFSVVNGVLLRPLPYDEPDLLVSLREISQEGHQMSVPEQNFLDWQQATRSYVRMGFYNSFEANIAGGNEPVRTLASQVSADFFDVLRVKPFLGRALGLEDHQQGAPPTVVVSHEYWRKYLGGAADLKDKVVRAAGFTFTIVGVMPFGFQFPTRVDVWAPRGVFGQPNPSRSAHNWRVIARMKPGVTLQSARMELSQIAKRIHNEYRDVTAVDASALPLQDAFTARIRPALLLLTGAVGLLLLIACANVMNMLLARATTREKEFAVRGALGASRTRLVRQCVTESLLLAVLAALLGGLLASWGVDALRALGQGQIPQADNVRVDTAVFGFALALSVLTSVLLGSVPGWRASRLELHSVMNEAGRGSSAGGGARRIRNSLVVSQVALTMMLLVGAGLLARSFERVIAVDLGFQKENRLGLDLRLPFPRNDRDAQRLREFTRQLEEKFTALPGVLSVGGTNAPPMSFAAGNGRIKIEGREDSGNYWPNYRLASPGYFKTLGIPLLRGRLFDSTDGLDTPQVAVISRDVAQKVFPGEDAIGRRINAANMDGDENWMTIVGVVTDVKEDGPENATLGTVYTHYLQRGKGGGIAQFTWVLHTAADPTPLIPSIRDAVRSLDPEVAPKFQTLEQMFSTATASRRFNLTLFAVFAALALALASLGIYGVLAYSVEQRTREIGIRMALGAQHVDVLRLVVGQGAGFVLLGLALGLGGALALGRVVRGLLYNVEPTDPLSFSGAALLLCGVALLACYIPARRAARVDPMVALRYE